MTWFKKVSYWQKHFKTPMWHRMFWLLCVLYDRRCFSDSIPFSVSWFCGHYLCEVFHICKKWSKAQFFLSPWFWVETNTDPFIGYFLKIQFSIITVLRYWWLESGWFRGLVRSTCMFLTCNQALFLKGRREK